VTTIDADAHVFESTATWSHISARDAAHRPILITTDATDIEKLKGADANTKARPGRWLIGQQAYHALTIDAAGYPKGAQSAADPDARIAHMDRLGVDIQVIYPTLFFGLITDSTDAERALVEAYHRWMADVCKSRQGRLRWVAPISPKNIDASCALLGAAKEAGAVGILIPTIDLDQHIGSRLYDPIYRLAQELDLPICIHLGHASAIYRLLRPEGVANAMYVTAPLTIACEAVIKMGLATRFPKIRWGFIEGSAAWVPYLCYRAVTQYGAMESWRVRAAEVLARNNIYVSCEAYEDFASYAAYGGDNYLMIGTDYGHTDPGVELGAFQALAGRNDLSPDQKRKLTETNAARFYGLS